MQDREKDERKTCLHCGRRHILPGTPEQEYHQMEACRDQEWIDMIAEQEMLYDNWL